MKPREGSASKGIVVVNSREELEKVGHFDRYLIQEYIADSEEYTVDCYVSTVDGEVLCAVPRIRLSTSGGEVDRTETRCIDELLELPTLFCAGWASADLSRCSSFSTRLRAAIC